MKQLPVFDPHVIYEDNHLIAINKPSGWLSQGDETGDMTAADWVKKYIKKKYNKPGDVWLGVVHRLDRPVSGVLLFARTSKAASRMTELFKKNEIKKTYWAITEERPDPLEGTLKGLLLRDQESRKSKIYFKESNRSKGAKLVELSYQFLAEHGAHKLIIVKPKTGRTHQIRAQFSAEGMPIRGDIKYGFGSYNKDRSIHLHSRKLEFIHPVKKEPISILAKITKRDQIWQLFRHLE